MPRADTLIFDPDGSHRLSAASSPPFAVVVVVSWDRCGTTHLHGSAGEGRLLSERIGSIRVSWATDPVGCVQLGPASRLPSSLIIPSSAALAINRLAVKTFLLQDQDHDRAESHDASRPRLELQEPQPVLSSGRGCGRGLEKWSCLRRRRRGCNKQDDSVDVCASGIRAARPRRSVKNSRRIDAASCRRRRRRHDRTLPPHGAVASLKYVAVCRNYC